QAMLSGKLFAKRTQARILQNQLRPEIGGHTLMFFAQPNPLCPSGDLLSPRAVGHSGYTGNVLTIDPEHDLVIVVLTNRVYIDADRLSMMEQVIAKLIKDCGREGGWSARGGNQRRQLLPGTDYAVCCVEVSGTACVAFDNDIPLKYGIDQCIGDTVGPGGLFK